MANSRPRGTSSNRPADRIPSIQEDKSTVRELENGWIACLRSLCRRLHATVSVRGQRVEPAGVTSTDNGRRYGEREGERGSAEIVADCHAEPRPTQLESAGEGLVKRLECPETAADVDKAGEDTLQPMGTGPVAAATIDRSEATIVARPEKVNPPPTSVDDAERDTSRLQGVRDGLPAFSSDRKEPQGGLWFDRALLRVGARVPWGRRHRGRFAKVKLLLSDDHPYESFMRGI